MADIRSILALEPVQRDICGFIVKLKRPTLCDLADMADAEKLGPVHQRAFMLHRHVLAEDGSAIFPTAADAMLAPAGFAERAVQAIDELYGEGRD